MRIKTLLFELTQKKRIPKRIEVPRDLFLILNLDYLNQNIERMFRFSYSSKF